MEVDMSRLIFARKEKKEGREGEGHVRDENNGKREIKESQSTKRCSGGQEDSAMWYAMMGVLL